MKRIKILFFSILFSGCCFFLQAQEMETFTAVSANEFLNSIGANSAIYRRGEHVDTTIASCRYLGMRWIRTDESGLGNNGEVLPEIKKLYEEAGVKVSVSLGSGGTNIDAVVKGAKKIAEYGGLIAIEGCNEPNNWGVTYQGEFGGRDQSWAPVARLHRDLYRAVREANELKDYPVWATTETGAQTDNAGMQYLTVPEDDSAVLQEFRGVTFADYANCHNYFTHPSWAPLQNNQTWLAADPTSKAKGDHLYGNYGVTWAKKYNGYTEEELLTIPKVTTETGVTLDETVTEEMQALMYLSLYLAQYKQGWKYTAMYLMRDRTDEGGNQTFGFYRPEWDNNSQRYRSVPRLSAHYMHNFTSILEDRQDVASPAQVTYAISPSRPETVHELLLQKSDGKLYLIIWSEKYRGGSDEIELVFDRPLNEVLIYNPTLGKEVIETKRNISSLPLTMTNHPFILVFDPPTTGYKELNHNEYSIYPRMVADILHISGPEKLRSVEVSYLSGHSAMKIEEVNSPELALNIHSLSKGNYILTLVSENNKTENHKIQKL
ncbi:MAG: T9SS type A sorting domain-containing protein [Candidatus Azobacteroides sp.]|nr:T9SS type A sorting domain-containing protein [Candidatus Azobacteroides sp.]